MWHRQGEEFIHINAVQPNGLLSGVTRYHFDKERRSAQFELRLKRSEFDCNHWQLTDVATTKFNERSTEVVNMPTELRTCP